MIINWLTRPFQDPAAGARRPAGRGFAWLAAGLAAAALGLGTTVAAASDSGTAAETASLTPATGAVELSDWLPSVLGAEDIDRYRRIFALQEQGKWRQADRQIKRLRSRLLVGHLQAQRYLHPTKYRSRYRELAAWMKRYADHPNSRRIYALAKKRKPRSARSPRRPSYAPSPVYEEYGWERAAKYVSTKRRSAHDRRHARRILNKVRRYARSGRLSLARRVIGAKRARRILDRVEMDLARSQIGAGYFFLGLAEKAYSFAGPAASRSGHHMAFGNWIAGLSAYRLGRYGEAADHFERMASSQNVSGWALAAAAFWAARSNMIGQRPQRVNRWLEVAADRPRTFYGLIAGRVLGIDKPFTWDIPEITRDRVDKVLRRQRGKRALALLQVGQTRLAERELRALTAIDDRELGRALLAVAEAAKLPSLSLRTAGMLVEADGSPHHGALYPVPQWRPEGGFIVDRALVYAFMRQESQFNTRAKSSAGARGLMQLMPATASFMAKRRFRGWRRNRLYDPELNIALGQKYLRYLIGHQQVQGDMLMLAAAYNGGPGNLAKWRRRAARKRFLDPLLFIESIPARETRIFIERVLSNLWIYRDRLGQESPSLDALAAGRTPVYKSLDKPTGSVAGNARN